MKRIFTFLMLLMTSTVISLAADTWTVAGTAAALNGTTDWAPTNAENDMSSTDGVNYTLTVTNCTLEKGVTYQYKVVKAHSWNESYPSSNKTFTVSETAVYTVEYTFNANTKDVNQTTTKTGSAGEITHTYSVAGEPQSIFGGSKEWDESNTATEMTLGGDGLYAWKASGLKLRKNTSIKFKVVVDHAWGQAYPASNFEETITEDGVYDLTITFKESTKDVNCIPNKTGDASFETVYVVAGDNETLFGTKWDGSAEANKMAKNASDIWEKTYANVTLSTGVIEWKVVMNGETWIPDGANKMIYVPEAGVYTLTFTYNETSGKVEGKLYDKDGKEVIVTPTGEGWPANYGGVMLQGFYWNSFEDSKLTELQKHVDEYSTYFDLIWLPNTGATGGQGMGYLPVYWLNHNSNFGRQNTLKKLIKAFNEKGTKVIEDVVVNHKAPKGTNGSWVDFVNEKWTHDGITEEINWTPADICRNDDGGYTNTMGADPEMVKLNGGWECTGADDTGDDFSGGRDLDHTSANVQKNCIIYLNYLQKELGYSGYRLDMVKGYSPYYTKLYNEATQPEFCVGEYWSGESDITSWIYGTGNTSAAFDFPFKYQVKDAFGNGNWSALDYKGICQNTDWQRYAVTFIDNHDTYENEGRLTKNVLPANAFMLAMPGTPCVFLKHWQRYPIAIGNMILARKAAGITNQSPIVEAKTVDGGYVLKVKGETGTVLCISGYVNGYDTTGFKLISNGINYAYFVSDNVTVEGLREGSDDEEAKEITIYIEADEAPYLYSWNSSGQPTNGAWPGTKLSTTVTKEDNKTFWTRNFSTVPVNIIINNGGDKTTGVDEEEIATGNNAVQSANIEGLTHDSYFTFDPTNTDKATNWTDITSNYYTPEPVQLPACAKAIENHVYCYFQGNKDYDSPRAYAWLGDKSFCGEFPGVKLTRVGDDGNGHLVWLWDAGDYVDLFDTYTPDESLFPSNILFNNGGSDPKTDDFVFQNGGYYDATGLVGSVTTGISAPVMKAPAMSSAAIYNLQGQRVDKAYRGIVIQNGKKYINR